jgi:hypothetical protein
VFPRSFEVAEGRDYIFNVEYDCNQLMRKNNKYYDTVRVQVTEGKSEIEFEFLVVCDASRLSKFDINFLVLFAIAVGVVVIAIKTPPLLVFSDMTSEEQE